MRLHNRSRKNNKRRVPQLNTTATADISFMLLIFFLVTTSMDNDKGLRRQLPPRDPQTEVQAVDVDRNKVLTISITPENKICVSDTAVTDDELSKRVAEFVTRIGEEHILELQCSRTADYDTYFHLQNVLVTTYKNNLRNKYKQRISETFY